MLNPNQNNFDSTVIRPSARGKFVYLGEQKLYLRGVTYGPFHSIDGSEGFATPENVERDFRDMAAAGINSIRTYTVPPLWVLDCAKRHGIWVLVGLPWEQHVAFLSPRECRQRIQESVRQGVRACAGHPALLGFAVGNEIPAPIVRWHGHQLVEKFIRYLCRIVKREDPGALVTYVNYPSTEYLELPFVDLFCFNIYLENPAKFEAYIARVQNLAGDKPLLLCEIGLDSRRNGELKQAETLDWQVRIAFMEGCAGLYIFSWTDEWYRGRQEILDWDFGLTRRDRIKKPALQAVSRAFLESPFKADMPWPRISVVVCTHNGVNTLAETLNGLSKLDYPDYEVIVVNDGCSPAVREIVGSFGQVRLINIPHSGLSVARNVGCETATGSIVAYLDDDAWPDRDWLKYLACAFFKGEFAAVGGPNIPPQSDRTIPTCIAHAPGGPIHVLLTDREAEHIPGCNMSFLKTALQGIGGFDPQFRVAGDDVDICWRLQDLGLKIGFHPGAMVWHHRRKTIRAYLKQQSGYGRAEALLERKWPAKYNAAGQPGWQGRIYGMGRLAMLSLGRSRIYHGIWGSALFQSLYEPVPSVFWSLARMPEWYVVVFTLAALMMLEFIWPVLFYVWPLLLMALLIPVCQALLNAGRLPLNNIGQRALVALLSLLQPLVRLSGRVRSGLTPWGRRRLKGFAIPRSRQFIIRSGQWRSLNDWLLHVEAPLEATGATVRRGGEYDRWDIEIHGGVLGGLRLLMLVEEHGQQIQIIRINAWPHRPPAPLVIGFVALLLAAGAACDAAPWAMLLFGGVGSLCLLAMFVECGAAMAALQGVLEKIQLSSKATQSGCGQE